MPTTWSTNWMSGIADDAILSRVSIPGTHDSCARKVLGAVCQIASITSQLNRGIRFLDIRCEYQNNFDLDLPYVYFPVAHGGAFQYITFEEVQAQCIAFLAQNPSECILMNVQMASDGSGDQFYKKFMELTAPYTDFWYLVANMPFMRDVRGKIVLIRACDSHGNGWGFGTGIGLAWSGFNTDGQSDDAWFSTQNTYSDTTGTAAKLALVTEYVGRAVAAVDYRYYLNFASWAGRPLTNAENMAPGLTALLKGTTFGTHVGVIIIDWASYTGDGGDSIENLIIEHQAHQMPGHTWRHPEGHAAEPVSYFSVARYAIRSARWPASLTPANAMRLPGTTTAGCSM